MSHAVKATLRDILDHHPKEARPVVAEFLRQESETKENATVSGVLRLAAATLERGE